MTHTITQLTRANTRPTAYVFKGDEDCLFLSVFADPKANDLPVMVWIRMYYPPACTIA